MRAINSDLVSYYLLSLSLSPFSANEVNGTRLGFMGHLVRMANQIAGNERLGGLGNMLDRTREEAVTTATVDEDRLQGELDSETYVMWSEFISGPIAEMNKKNDTNLVCYY